jgi:hypothetical protein
VGTVLSITGVTEGGEALAATNVFVIESTPTTLYFIYPCQARRVSEKANVLWLRRLYDPADLMIEMPADERRKRKDKFLRTQCSTIQGKMAIKKLVLRQVADFELSTEPEREEEVAEDETAEADEGAAPAEAAGRRVNYGNGRTGRLTTEECGRLMQEAFGAAMDRSESTAMVTVEQKWWYRTCVLGGKLYFPPGGCTSALVKDFFQCLIDMLTALTRREQSSEMLIIFLAVILQRKKGVDKAADIRRLLLKRITMWKANQFEDLVSEAEQCDSMLRTVARTKKGNPMDADQIASVFSKMVFQGKIREAVRFVTEQTKGGVLEVTDEITVKKVTSTVKDHLEMKHPAAALPHCEALLPRPKHADGSESLEPLIEVTITAGDVETIARRIRGGGGPGGSDASIWQRLLLHHGALSARLRDAVAALGHVMANEEMDWKLIRALVANRLVALDKCPGVRPIGIGECLRRILGKVMAKVTRDSATLEAGADQLCMGLAGGIEGAIHGMNELFQQFSEDDDTGGYGMLLVDAANAFNAVNRITALWHARILWRSCARFIFNTYRGYAYLIVRSTKTAGAGTIMLSREGVTQGTP